MHFFSFFKTLIGKEVIIELKNDLALRGTLHSVDQYLNVKLTNMEVVNATAHPHLMAVRNCFVRGSVVRYIQLPAGDIDTQLLQDAARRAARQEDLKK
jgi:U6 snRNA-associated Sm-like protein LSm2